MSGLLSKEELMAWTERAINKAVQPDIFFIDLFLLRNKTDKEILHYISEYIDFEEPIVTGRPLLGLLWKRFSENQILLKDAVHILYNLIWAHAAVVTEKEENFMSEIDYSYDLATEGYFLGTLEDVKDILITFLTVYKEYTLENLDRWKELDLTIDDQLNKVSKIEKDRMKRLKFLYDQKNNTNKI